MSHVRMDKLLTAVWRAIRIDKHVFYVFMEVLGANAKYGGLVEKMKPGRLCREGVKLGTMLV